MFKLFSTTILALLIILGFNSSSLTILAQEIDLPDSLIEGIEEEDHDYEEELLEVQSKLTQISETKFDRLITGFFLHGADFSVNKVFIEVTNVNDQVEGSIEVIPDDESFGEQSPEFTNIRSQLFYFEQGVKSVRIFSEKEVNDIEVKIIQTKSDASFTPQASLPYAGQKQKDYYNNLNIQLKVREEWGVPRLTEWDLEGGGTMTPWQAHDINKIVIHHTASNPNNSDPAAAVRAIYELHKNNCENGGVLGANCSENYETWQDIGYNFIIDQNGTVYEGRSGGDSVVGAHSPPNYGTIGIALIGNFNSTMPNDSVKNALKNLIIQLSALHDFEPDWGTTIYGHRDRSNTICPGGQLYSFLPAIVDEAENEFATSSGNEELTELRNQLYVDRADLMQVDQSVSLMINIDSISLIEKTFLEQNLYTTSIFRTVSNHYIFTVDDDYVSKILKDTKLFFPNAQIQPVYVKTTSATWTDAGGRATTDNYDSTTHWYLEKIEAPEAWSELGGCQTDELCQGDPSVTIAMIDTGVAYEDYDYDAGAYDDQADTNGDGTPNSIVNVNGLNIEVPNSEIANDVYDEGYDRQYRQSPELANVNFVSPYDITQDFLCDWRAGSAYPCNAAELEKRNHANDDDGHGTFGTIIMTGDPLGPRDGGDVSESDLIGISNNVSIMPIKAFFPNDSSMCYEPDGDHDPTCASPNENLKGVTFTFLLTEAIEYAVDNGADVINMSLGGGGADPALQEAINDAVNANVIIVAASGNTNSSVNNFYPAAFDNVIAVGASTQTDQRASYSNYGSKLDIVAPVGDTGIPSQWFDCSNLADTNPNACFRETPYSGGGGSGMFQEFSNGESPGIDLAAGTSFAAPQVSAAVALLKSRFPSATPEQIENTLKTTATDILTAGKDDQSGYGILNLDEALQNLWMPIYSKPVYRFFNASTGTHFYTVSESEKTKIQTQPGFEAFDFEGIAMYGNASNSIGVKPVYRFFNTATGTHFYTISESEKTKLQTNPDFSNFDYEGISYYANNGTLSGTRPVYRFFKFSGGTHFYTASTTERDKLLNDPLYSDYEFEGISFTCIRMIRTHCRARF